MYSNVYTIYTISERELRTRDCSSGTEALDHVSFYTHSKYPLIGCFLISSFVLIYPIYGNFLVFFAICC